MARRLIPLLDRVVIEKLAAPAKTIGGVLLPESAVKQVMRRRVLCLVDRSRRRSVKASSKLSDLDASTIMARRYQLASKKATRLFCRTSVGQPSTSTEPSRRPRSHSDVVGCCPQGIDLSSRRAVGESRVGILNCPLLFKTFMVYQDDSVTTALSESSCTSSSPIHSVWRLKATLLGLMPVTMDSWSGSGKGSTLAKTKFRSR